MQDPEIDLVGAMRISRVARGLDVRRVVVQQIEHKMAFVLMGADDLGVDRYVVGNHRAGAHALVPAEILGRIPGIEGVDLGFKPLAITAGMQFVSDIEQLKRGQFGGRIGNGIVGVPSFSVQ